jgi:hypothetical protein
MRPEPEMIPVLVDAAEVLKGSQKRLFMAKTVRAMGRAGNDGPKCISTGAGTPSAKARTNSAPA